jgi:hypothetical protein
MQKLLLVGISAALSAVAACGGSVVFVEDDDGSGGSGTTSSKSAGPTGSKTSGVTTLAVTTNAVGTAGTGMLCDLSAIEGDCATCVAETLNNGACKLAVDDCLAYQSCVDLDICIGDCGASTSCCGDCHANAEGAAVSEFYEAVTCLYCNACSAPCANLVPDVCGF